MNHQSFAFRLLAAQVARFSKLPPPIHENPLIAHHPLFLPERLPTPDHIGTLWLDAERITQQMVLEIARVATEDDSLFGVVVIPERVQIEPEFRALVLPDISPSSIDITRPNRQLGNFAESNAIWLMDLLTVFLDQPSEPALYLGYADVHWSETGHQLAATEIARAVSRRVRNLASDQEWSTPIAADWLTRKSHRIRISRSIRRVQLGRSRASHSYFYGLCEIVQDVPPDWARN